MTANARPDRRRRQPFAAVAALLVLAATAGCGTGAAATGPPQPQGDPLAAVHKSDAAAALLPAKVRAAGTLRIGSSVGAPPSAYYPDGTGAPVGQDIDLADAAAKVLGLRLKRQDASFETILPALGSGKYDLGTGNFGVTNERLKTLDFVTYIDDGQGFSVRTGNTSFGHRITRLTQLCGRTVGIGAGTTFEATLDAGKHLCADRGRRPYQVKAYSENGAELTALQQGRIDVIMSTINGLRYQAAHPAARTTFLGEYHRLDVGFAFAKHSPLTPAFRAAVNELIKDGSYARILKKWGTSASAIPTSRINPPEHR